MLSKEKYFFNISSQILKEGSKIEFCIHDFRGDVLRFKNSNKNINTQV